MSEPDTAIPSGIRLRLARAAVQVIADGVGADMLHIKGDAVDATLRPHSRAGTDVDVLVRPGHVDALDRGLCAHGWTVYSTFTNGSPFGHAQTYMHKLWGYVDVHRSFPGIGLDPSAAFDRCWLSRTTMGFAGRACPTPGREEQAMVLLLNAARARSVGGEDVRTIWFDADPEDRARLDAIVAEFEARTAFDAAIGELERHRGEPDYRLWKAVSQGGTRFEEWRGRFGLARTLPERLALLARALTVNVEHLGHKLGRPPRPFDVVKEFFARPIRGLSELGFRRRGRRS